MRCIVSCGVGGWYRKGVQRLDESLDQVQWTEGRIIHKGVWPEGCPPHHEIPYGFKLHTIQEAIDQGYQQVLWLDASAWAIRHPEDIFRIIQKQGHYFWTSGYKCDEWCNDKSLDYFGVTRAEAGKMEMLYALVVGLDLTHDRTWEFFSRWKKSLEDGMFNGSWKREANDKEEFPYLGHRHDQSCASIIAHQLGMGIDMTFNHCDLYREMMKPTVALTFQGM